MNDLFIGRESELKALEDLYDVPGSKAIAILGRRRIGKTSLMMRFVEGRRHLYFAFFEDGTINDNLHELRRGIKEFTRTDPGNFEHLLDALDELKKICSEERTVLIFDEYQYLSRSFKPSDSMIRTFIDVGLRGTDTMLIVSGSSYSMMLDCLDDGSRPLYGRFPNRIYLGPLTPQQCIAFHPEMSDEDQIRTYLTIGGVPYYQTQMSGRTYEDALRRCFFTRGGPLFDEGRLILESELRPITSYSTILDGIARGYTKNGELVSWTGLSKATVSECVSKLIDIGIVKEVHPKLRTKSVKPALVIGDYLLAFWYGIVRNIRVQMESMGPDKIVGLNRDGIATFLGKRFELLVMEHMVRSYPVKSIGRWMGMSGGHVTDIDVVADVLDEMNDVIHVLCECEFTRKEASLADLIDLQEMAESAGCTENRRFMIFSGYGFKENLVDQAESTGAALIGIDQILGKIPPVDPLRCRRSRELKHRGAC